MQYNSKAKFIYILGKIGSTHNTIETVEQMVTFVVGDHHLERYSLRRAFAPNECTCWVSDGSICTWYAIKTADTLSFNLCLPGTRWTHTWAHWFRNLKGEKIISKNRCSCGFHCLHLMPHTIITWRMKIESVSQSPSFLFSRQFALPGFWVHMHCEKQRQSFPLSRVEPSLPSSASL